MNLGIIAVFLIILLSTVFCLAMASAHMGTDQEVWSIITLVVFSICFAINATAWLHTLGYV